VHGQRAAQVRAGRVPYLHLDLDQMVKGASQLHYRAPFRLIRSFGLAASQDGQMSEQGGDDPVGIGGVLL
jgi:hypothetical protein